MNGLVEAKEILAGCLFIPKEKIDLDAEIGAIGEMDSLAFEMMVLEIEKRTGRAVDPMQLLELRFVKDLVALLENR